MNIPKVSNPFAHKPTFEELQQKNEYASEELSLKKKQALMRELEERGGRDKWKEMTDDGTKKGINWSRILQWLRTH